MASEKRKGQLVKAHQIHKNAGMYPEEVAADHITNLAEQGIWSNRQIASLVGVPPAMVNRLVLKEARTGGRFNPSTLPLILEEIALAEAGESNALLTAEIWSRGTSASFLARLLEQPKSSVAKRAVDGRRLAEAHGDG